MIKNILYILVFVLDKIKTHRVNKANEKHKNNIDTGVTNVTGGVSYSSREEMLRASAKDAKDK